MKRRNFLQFLGISPFVKLGQSSKGNIPDIELMLKEGEAILRKEWEDKYYENLYLAQRALDVFVDDDLREQMEKEGFFCDPNIIKMFYRMGKETYEELPLIYSENEKEIRNEV